MFLIMLLKKVQNKIKRKISKINLQNLKANKKRSHSIILKKLYKKDAFTLQKIKQIIINQIQIRKAQKKKKAQSPCKNQ